MFKIFDDKKDKEKEKENEDIPKENNTIISKVSTLSPDNSNELSLMKKGDYSVHVLIEEVKNLSSRKPNTQPLPMIKVTCFNKSKRTSKPPQECEAYTFNEHIYFDKTDLSVDDLDSSKIIIEVYDYHDSEKEYYFGIQEFDFEYIYSKESHCLKNTWIALANPAGKDITKVNGYLKLSINICSTEDEKVELNPDATIDSSYILPSQIKTTYKQMQIYIFKGDQFPDMDNWFGDEKINKRRCNASVEVKYLGVSKSTQYIKMEKEIVEWNELLEIPVPQPIISQKVVFTLKDKNKLIIGSFMIAINDIIKGKYNELSCINIYGSLKAGDKSEAARMMNENPELGSRWKGRIYLKINYKDEDYPNAGVQKITDVDLIETVKKKGRTNLWNVYIKLYSASFLPTEDGTYDIKIAIQESYETFTAKKAENRNIDWNICRTFSIQTFTENLEELPDIIIYLRQNSKEICFQRIKLSKFHLNDNLNVIKLYPEPCVGAVKEIYYSGIIKIKIKLFNPKIDPEDKCRIDAFRNGDEYGAIKMGLNNIISKADELEDSDDDDLENLVKKDENQQNTDFKFYTIVVCVYMTRYLVSGNSSGLSDPYCVISINGDKKQTSTKYKCVNGIWNEKLIFNNVAFSSKEKVTWPVLLVTVMDKKITSDEMLGYSYIWLIDTAYAMNQTTSKMQPKWHQLYLKKSNKAQGQILLLCHIINESNEQKDNDNFNINNIQIEPDITVYNAEINVLGLRDLKPLSFIKIKKPYISFDLNSINVSNGENVSPVTTSPNEAGANPNINTFLKFMIKLPKNELYIPEFQCDVYDHVLGGLSKRILGIFLIDLKQIIAGTKNHYKLERDEAERVMKILDEKKDKNIAKKKQSRGMTEKEELDNNIITNSKEDFLLDKDVDINNNLRDTNIEIDKIEDKNMFKSRDTFLCNFPSDLKILYRGDIDNSLLEKEKHNSEYFAIKPSFKIYPLSKKIRQKIKQNQAINGKKKENGMVELEVIENQKDSDKDEENLIEDASNMPNRDLFFPIGFNKNDNPMKYNETGEIKNMLGELEVKNEDDDEKEGLIKKNEIIITNNKKHYRRIYRKELENVKELALGAPFIKIHLLRNKYEDNLSSLSNLFEAIKNEDNKILKSFEPKKIEKKKRLRAIENLRMNYIETTDELQKCKELLFDSKYYGYFKGLMRLAKKSDYDSHKKYIEDIADKYGGELPPELLFLTAFDDFGKSVLVKKTIIVRVYVLELNNLAKRDSFSESDPYIKILLGEKVLVDERKKHFNNAKNCKWYQYYDLKIELPGSSKLRIQVMDYDNLFTDDLVGETSIDIEDRYFDNRWQALKNKPIEVRQLYHPDFENSQGEVLLWIEMFEQKTEDYKMEPWNINPEPISTLQMRLIIYETEDMENLDFEDVSDIYVMAFIDGKNKQQTDVHYRCQNGHGSFNWRMIIPLETPRDKYDLSLQVFDSDIFSKDDFICGGRINLYEIINDANRLDLPIKFNKDYFESLPQEKKNGLNIVFDNYDEEGNNFWIQLEKQGKQGGRVLCSIEIVPQWYAERYPVGIGRSEPNINPYLPPPTGRISFTLNPFSMLNQYTGPKFRKKCYKRTCCIILVIYLLCLIPSIVFFIAGEIINPFNYTKLFKKK